MGRRPRPLSPAEAELWRAAMRETRRLARGRAREPVAEAEAAEAGRPESPANRRPAPPAASRATPVARQAPERIPELGPGRGPGLDRRQAERLRRGQLPIEGRLDLHGLTQAEAHRRLDAFVAAALAEGKRCLLVITGKGLYRGGSGVLREAVPRWLNEPPLRAHLLAFAPARPQHGGEGALYLLLKRKRER